MASKSATNNNTVTIKSSTAEVPVEPSHLGTTQKAASADCQNKNSGKTARRRRRPKLTRVQIAALSGDNGKGVSLCIPRLFNNITEVRVKRVFRKLNWGKLARVDMIPTDGTKRAFIHFEANTFSRQDILKALCEGKECKITYDDPWWWNISLSRTRKPLIFTRQRLPQVEISERKSTPPTGDFDAAFRPFDKVSNDKDTGGDFAPYEIRPMSRPRHDNPEEGCSFVLASDVPYAEAVATRRTSV